MQIFALQSTSGPDKICTRLNFQMTFKYVLILVQKLPTTNNTKLYPMTSFIVRPNGTITVKPLPHMRCRTTNLHTKNNALKEQQELVAYKDKVNIKVLYIETNVISKCKKMQDKWMPFNDIGNKNILTGTKFILNTNEVL